MTGSAQTAPAPAPLVLFDGDCNLCHGAVQFVLRRDPKARFRFASLQSAAGRAAIVATGRSTKLPDSIVFVRDGRLLVKSAAALAIALGLRWPWPLLAVFWLVPYPVRDLVYDWIARHRHRWFGRRQECWVPTPALRARFLDADEREAPTPTTR
ncbi:MAG TPA: DCC1-like thiol-disulfide oxidoreductase family protein [Planctomycetota bacterium]